VHLGGVAWGFDDRADTNFGVSSREPDGCYVSDGRVSQSQQHAGGEIEEFDASGRRTGGKAAVLGVSR
jgi:hypothetical protein